MLRKCWLRFFNYDWKFGIFLILLFGIPRFIMVLQTNISGSYGLVSIIFMIMWFAPLIFLTKEGRNKIGIRKPKRYLSLVYSLIAGVTFCGLLFLVSQLLYGDSINNSFVYISRTNAQSGGILDSQRFMFFLIGSLASLPFSPIGEEFLYRGIIHGSFVEKFGETKASYIDSLAFALTHLAHFGIVYNAGIWQVLPLPALFWVVSMFLLSLVFFRCKLMSNSIWGAVVSHAGYNITMMYFIFYHIL